MRYRQYRLKFYVNLRHFIYIDGKKGQLHPHTWEFCLNILKTSNEFVQFQQMQKEIDHFLSQYQDQILNEVEPFDRINPTLENCCEYMAEEIGKILRNNGYILLMVEISETPSKSYIISYLDENGTKEEHLLDVLTDNILKDIKNGNRR